MKKVLSLFICILCSIFILSSVSITPFSIYADYMPTSPFVGVNYYIEEYDNENRVTLNSGNTTLSLSGSQTNTLLVQRTSNGVTYVTSTYSQGDVSGNGGTISLSGNINLNSTISNTQVVYRVIHFTIILDDTYIGYVRPVVTRSGNSTNLFAQDLAVNGNSIDFQIVDNNVSTDVAGYNISLTNFNLVLNNQNNWEFPIESFSIVSAIFDKGLNPDYTFLHGRYIYPVFKLQPNTDFMTIWLNTSSVSPISYTMVLLTNQNIFNLTQLLTFLNMEGLNIYNFELINRGTNFDGTIFTLFKIDFYSNSSQYKTFSSKNSAINIIPVYFGFTSNEYISTDFALNYGLNNKLLNNLDTIVNGTQSSNQSSSSAESSNSQLSDEISNYQQVEQQLTGDFQDNLNDINVQSPLNIFGSGFVQSANWVRTQFDTLTNNNPFGSLLTFSLILGVGLLIIGKVFG